MTGSDIDIAEIIGGYPKAKRRVLSAYPDLHSSDVDLLLSADFATKRGYFFFTINDLMVITGRSYHHIWLRIKHLKSQGYVDYSEKKKRYQKDKYKLTFRARSMLKRLESRISKELLM